jgi:triphosphatase
MHETELKFVIDAAADRRLRGRAAALAGQPAPTRGRQVTSRYFDTPAGDLHAQGIALRVRRNGRRWEQTVKLRTGLTGGLQTAEELDAPAPGGHLDLAAIPDPGLAERIARIVGGAPLAPVCETAMRRIRVDIARDSARVAVMFDTGEIRAGGTAQPFREIELELVAGPLGALFDVARALFADDTLHFSTLSKPERGLLLARTGRIEPEPAPCGARAVPLDPGQTAESAAQVVLREGFAQIAANIAVVVAGDDPEGPHQLRVGLRRLRSAMLLFRPVVGCPELDRIGAEARWLGQEVGALRDLDVAIHDIVEPQAAAHPAETGFAPLLAALDARRGALRDRLRDDLGAGRTRAFLLDLARFVETRGWLAPEDIGQTELLAAPLAGLARTALQKRWRAVAKRARGIGALDIEARHDLRKALKKLRYGVEFLGPVFKPKPVRAFTARLKTLQALFGDLNDLAMAEALFSGPDAPAAADPAAQRAAGIVLGARGARAEAAWRHAQEEWDALRAAPKFWH